MKTTIEVMESAIDHAYTHALKISGLQSQQDALHAAKRWCEENKSSLEYLLAWENNKSEDGNIRTDFYIKVCSG